MDSEQKFYMDESNFGKEKTTELPKDVETILEQYRLLNTENKVLCRQLIRDENIF